jgi:hypothetical protein
LAPIFHQKSRHPENVYFETSMRRKLRFSTPKPPILASVFYQFFTCFLISLLDAIFPPFFRTWCQKVRFWEPLWHPAGPKMGPKSAKWRQKSLISRKP